MKFKFWLINALIPVVVFAQDLDSPNEIKMETNIQTLGDYVQFTPTAVSLIAVLAKNDREGFWQLAKSASANLGATYLLKYAINKQRPEGALDGKAFPSGHTSFAFQGASFLQRRYGWKYGIPAYALAAYVGWSRIEGIGERHDGWDVLGGALVGIGSTYLFTTPYAKEHFKLSFSSSAEGHMIGFQFNF